MPFGCWWRRSCSRLWIRSLRVRRSRLKVLAGWVKSSVVEFGGGLEDDMASVVG